MHVEVGRGEREAAVRGGLRLGVAPEQEQRPCRCAAAVLAERGSSAAALREMLERRVPAAQALLGQRRAHEQVDVVRAPA